MNEIPVKVVGNPFQSANGLHTFKANLLDALFFLQGLLIDHNEIILDSFVLPRDVLEHHRVFELDNSDVNCRLFDGVLSLLTFLEVLYIIMDF